MFDINELMNRAKGAKEQASRQMEELMRSTEELQAGTEAKEADLLNRTEETENAKLQAEAETEAANRHNIHKQKEVLTQMMGEEFAKQSAMMREQVSEEVKKQVGEIAAMNAQELLGKLYGDDLAILSAACDTLEQLEGTDDPDWEEEELTPEQLYAFVEERMEQIGKMDEPPSVPYADNLEQWRHFAVLLSGIISTVNDHALDALEVEEHIPVMDQQIANLVRNSWGITGREDLLDTLCGMDTGPAMNAMPPRNPMRNCLTRIPMRTIKRDYGAAGPLFSSSKGNTRRISCSAGTSAVPR